VYLVFNGSQLNCANELETTEKLVSLLSGLLFWK